MAGKNPLIVALFAVSIAVISASAAVIVLKSGGSQKETVTMNDGVIPRIAYATEGVTVTEDPDELSRMVQEMNASAGELMALSYKNDAYSEDGRTFQCYIANSPFNQYDMFIAIYADAAYTELLYLSELLRPGAAFERVTLERELPLGDNEVYVAFTQVEEADGQQAIHGQNRVTMNFHVL